MATEGQKMAMTATQAKIAVGMDRTDAAKLLRAAGARVTKIDGTPPRSNTDRTGVVYEIPTGGLLIVDYDRASSAASYHISGLRLCNYPDVPKAKRLWRDVTELTV